jgi:hypothetical protein
MLDPAGPNALRGPDDSLLPNSASPATGHVNFRDLPRTEQVRRKCEDMVRWYAGKHGKVLTAEALGNFISWRVRYVGVVTLTDVAAALNDPVTVANLRGLGILDEEVLTWDEALEAKVRPSRAQMDALDAVFERLDPKDDRSLSEILSAHGIELRQWHGWLADPIFAGYVRERTQAVIGQNAHEVDIALMRKVVGGDTAAIKLALMLQGRLSDNRAVDAGQLLGRVLEILLEEISDMGAIERIARRFEAMSQAISANQPLPPAISPPVVIESEQVAG